MQLLKRKPLSVMLLLSFGALLPSCSTPPDVLGCTPYIASEWPEMRDTFLKLCSDDPACKVRLLHWQQVIPTWSYPTDSGTCVTWVTQKIYDIDSTHPLPATIAKMAKDQSWPDLMATGISLPAKASYAPMKTYIQSQCHDNQQCGSIGNWQGTIQATDQTLNAQNIKVQTVKAKNEF